MVDNDSLIYERSCIFGKWDIAPVVERIIEVEKACEH